MEEAVGAPCFQGRLHGWRRCCLIEEAQRGLVDLEFSSHENRFGYSLGWPGGLAFRSWEIAVTICAGANGFANRMLLGTPLGRPFLPVSAGHVNDSHRYHRSGCVFIVLKKRNGLFAGSGKDRVKPAV